MMPKERSLTGLADEMRRRRVATAERAIAGSKLRAGISAKQALECVMLSLEALDMHFYAQYRGRGADVMANPGPILETMRLYLEVVSRGLFVE